MFSYLISEHGQWVLTKSSDASVMWRWLSGILSLLNGSPGHTRDVYFHQLDQLESICRSICLSNCSQSKLNTVYLAITGPHLLHAPKIPLRKKANYWYGARNVTAFPIGM